MHPVHTVRSFGPQSPCILSVLRENADLSRLQANVLPLALLRWTKWLQNYQFFKKPPQQDPAPAFNNAIDTW